MNVNMPDFAKARRWIEEADGLLIGAGAGMGVDSGLPDFRGSEGFWKAYPMFQGRSFMELATPKNFQLHPRQAWGFYGHRLNLYRETVPHAGFNLLKTWAETKTKGYFVFTSNVDGHFSRAGFDPTRIVECHGSLHHLQCMRFCTEAIWPADDLRLEIDSKTMEVTSELPHCPFCGKLARPNVLLFSDMGWIDTRTEEQLGRFRTWLQEFQGANLVAIELGAGTAIPTVRRVCEVYSQKLIRINPRDALVPEHGLSLEGGALEMLEGITRS